MKYQKIIPFYKKDGTRTSITLSEYQLHILDNLAKYLGISRTQYINKVLDLNTDYTGNMSTCVKDEIIATLIKILITKGVII